MTQEQQQVAPKARSVEHHVRNLERLEGLPLFVDYVSPPEVLELMELSGAYRVDWTAYLPDPTPLRGEGHVSVRRYMVWRTGDDMIPCLTEVEVRMADWPNMRDRHDHYVPAMSAGQARQLIGDLRYEIQKRIDEVLR